MNIYIYIYIYIHTYIHIYIHVYTPRGKRVNLRKAWATLSFLSREKEKEKKKGLLYIFALRRFVYKGDTSIHEQGTDPRVALGA